MTRKTISVAARRPLAAWGALSAAALLLTACASTPVPREEMALADATVSRVSASPRALQAAPLQLQSAKDKLQRARAALEKGDNAEARRLAEAARADARLADAMSAEARSAESLKEVQDGISALESELGTEQGVRR